MSNIFSNYFNNSGIKYQSTPLVCDSDANGGKDLEFSFDDSQGIISDSRDVISSIDLSDITYALDEYNKQTKVLAPYTSYLLAGLNTGPAYAAQYFKVCYEVECAGDVWTSYVNMQFNLSHLCNFRQTTTRFETFRIPGDISDVIDTVQTLLDKQNLPIQVSVEKKEIKGHKHDFISFISTQIGFEFIVTDLRLVPIYQDEDFPDSPFVSDEVQFTGDDSEDKDISDFFPNGEVDCTVINKIINSIINHVDLDEDFFEEWKELVYFMSSYNPEIHKLYEFLPWRVLAQKYPNGAMGGLLIKVEYPENVSDSSLQALKINHVKDCVSKYNAVVLTEDASLLKDCCDDDYDEWHTPTVHDRVLYQKYDYTVRASYLNPEENEDHDWMDGGIYVRKEQNISDQVEDDGWVSGTRAYEVKPRRNYSCYKSYVSNQDYTPDEDEWVGSTPLPDSLYWADGHVDTQDFLGMYGYLNWVHDNNDWINVGRFYSILGAHDSANDNIRTLIPSAFIFNPNPFPVKIEYLMFI